MIQTQLVAAALYVVGAILAVSVAMWIAVRRPVRGVRKKTPPAEPVPDALVFLMRDGSVINTNFAARRMLDCMPGDPNDTLRLQKHLAAHFPDSALLLSLAGDSGDLYRASNDSGFQALREVAGRDVRLELTSRYSAQPGPRDLYNMEAESEELRLLRANIQAAPFLLWRQSASGEVIWTNRAYLEAARGIFGPERVAVWPLPLIFPELKSSAPSTSGGMKRTQAALRPGGKEAWYDCHVIQVDGDNLCTAFPADEAVRSEQRRREFTKTLTKTFADLAIGLAIFDRSRRLVLFNPALTDLTTLATDFLTSRPSLVSFLDQLRERRVMPEPRDYRSWRTSIAEIESASMDGTYSETWSLPDGQTYRVSGRPHPDGAVALLFEDISAEMSLTRKFRTQLEQSHDVIDAFEDAVAVFSGSGELSHVNYAYKELWGDHPDGRIAGTNVTEATRTWHEQTVPTPIWGDFRDFVFQGSERTEWSALVVLRDGRSLGCRFVPQRGGSTLAIFRIQTGASLVSEKLKEAV